MFTTFTHGVDDSTGADVSHGDSSAAEPSIAAVVASLNDDATLYTSRTRAIALKEPSDEAIANRASGRLNANAKPRREEMIPCLGEMLKVGRLA